MVARRYVPWLPRSKDLAPDCHVGVVPLSSPCIVSLQLFVSRATNVVTPKVTASSCSLGMAAADCSGLDYGALTIHVDNSCSLTTLNVSCLVACNCSYYQATSNQQCTVCEKCPPGGQCSADNILAVAGQWGAPSADGVVTFARCPPGYCCGARAWPCTERSSCAGNRHGQLCGDCLPGFVESIGSEQCVAVSTCTMTGKAAIVGVSFVVFIAAALVQLVPVSGVWMPSKTFPSGKAKLVVFFAQVRLRP